ncbi:MAG: sigma 54-interacting transcriptional regulator [Acidobacteriia bacterium]|nr:sigma 54-interacting transcriptional regulator [Terriglobia bacterium]
MEIANLQLPIGSPIDETRIRLVIDTIPGMVWSCLANGSLDVCNQSWVDFTGTSLEQARGWGWTAVIHRDDLGFLVARWKTALAEGKAAEFEARIRRADGEYHWFLIRSVPLYDPNGRIVRWYGTNIDIEDRKRAEQDSARLSQTLQTLYECDQALVRAGDEHELLQSICRILVDVGGMRMAWAGYREYDEEKTVSIVAHAGHEDGYLSHSKLSWGDSESGSGPTGTAIRTGKPCWIRHSQTDPDFILWRAEAVKRGYLSSISLPLMSDGVVFGALALYAGEPDAFNERTLQQFTELANNVAYGVTALRTRQEHRKAEDALRRSEAYLSEGQRLSRTGSFGWNAATGDIFWSAETFRIFDVDPAKTKPTLQLILERIHPEDRRFVEPLLERVVREKTDWDLEHRAVLPNGSTRHLHVVARASLNRVGELEFIGAVMDITERKRVEEELRRSENYLAEGQRLSHTGSWAWNVARRENVFWSREHFRIFGLDPEKDEPCYDRAFQQIHPDDRPAFERAVEAAIREKRDFNSNFRITLRDGSMKHVYTVGHPFLDEAGNLVELIGTAVDVTERKQAESLLFAEKHALEMIAGGASLKDILNDLCEAIDQQAQGLISTVLLMDPDGQHLWPIAGPRVPEGWTKTITPLKIGPGVGSCGTAAHLKQPVIVSDIADDPLWADFKDAVMAHGLRACWSQPLVSTAGEVVGTFAMYYTEPKNPGKHELQLSERAAHLALIAIERERARKALEKAFDEIKTLRDQLYKENLALRDEIDRASMFEEIVGSAPALQEVLSRIAKVAPSDSTVLITGETGTGKELVARAIHKRSQRSGRAFVSVNCAAIPPSLIASELFGHEKGAFTGALQRRLGRFELADGGTIFLDEIGELPPETQVALLRVLQEREFERIGGAKPMRTDVRVVAATNRDLQAAVAAGSFRLDLFYRLNVFPINVPPLRERKEDISMLVEYFIERYAGKVGKRIRSIEKNTLDRFQTYQWPGNIRELQNVIERSVILCENDVFSVDESWLSSEVPRPNRPSSPLVNELVDHEKEMIEAALAETKGRVAGSSGAAAKLGIPPSTLESKIRNLKISKSRFKHS